MRRMTNIAAIVLFAAVACSSGTQGSDTIPPPNLIGDSTIAGHHEATRLDSDLSGVPEELEFTATLIGGGTIDATSLTGTDILFWFWTPG